MKPNTGDIHQTASDWFLVKVANGQAPLVWSGGSLDGLRYFVIDIGGTEWWLTDSGLYDPATTETSNDVGDGPPRGA